MFLQLSKGYHTYNMGHHVWSLTVIVKDVNCIGFLWVCY